MCVNRSYTLIKKYIINLLSRLIFLMFNKLLWLSVVFSALLFTWTINSDRVIQNYETSSIPVILWWTSGFPDTSETRICPNNIKCNVLSPHNKSDVFNIDAYMFYASNIDFNNLPLPRKPNEIYWGLFHEESPRNVVELMHDVTLSLFNYTSTFSRHSDVPFPLQYVESIEDITSTKYFVPTSEKNMLDISPVLYLQTDCDTSTERDAYVKELMQYINIDSYGACLNNKEMPHQFTEDYLNKLNDDAFLHFIARYKFVIAIENGICEDYITEKFWRAIKVGNVPIYLGSPSVRDWFPNNKSGILLEDHPTPKVMSEYLNKLLNDDELYESHLIHKTKQVITNEKLIDDLKTKQYQTDTLKVIEKFECFVCEAIYNRRLGLNTNSVVNKRHYNCPEPISALNLDVNPENDWVYAYKAAKINIMNVYKRIESSPN